MDWKYHLTSFDGRTGRKPYWIAMLTVTLVCIILFLLGEYYAVRTPASIWWTEIAAIVLTAYPYLAVAIKRLHDRNKTGWWAAVIWAPTVMIYLGWFAGLIGETTTAYGDVRYFPNMFGYTLYGAQTAICLWFLVELGFLRGTKGANRYGPDPLASSTPGRASWWIRWIGIPVGGLIALATVAIVVLAMMFEMLLLPSGRVEPGHKLWSKDVNTLRAAQIIGPDEKIELFYPEDFFSLLKSGVILTDRRLVRFLRREDDKWTVFQLDLKDLASIRKIPYGDNVYLGVYQVEHRKKVKRFKIILPGADFGETAFINAVEKKIAPTGPSAISPQLPRAVLKKSS